MLSPLAVVAVAMVARAEYGPITCSGKSTAVGLEVLAQGNVNTLIVRLWERAYGVIVAVTVTVTVAIPAMAQACSVYKETLGRSVSSFLLKTIPLRKWLGCDCCGVEGPINRLILAQLLSCPPSTP